MSSFIQINPRKKSTSLSSLVAKGAFWQFSGGLLSTVIRLGASTILARLLNPIDFGILGMGIIAMNIVMYLGNMGINAAIVSKKDLSKVELSTGFWILIINRLFLYLAVFFLAPLIALFFKEPRVVSVIRVVSIVFLLSAFENIPRAILVRNLQYKELFFIKFVSTFFEAIIAIFLVYYLRMNYWALVIAMLGSYFVNLLLLYIFIRWIPSCCFSRKALSFYKKYILNGLGNSVVNYLKQNIDYWVVGKVLGAASLGLYEYAYKIPHMFVERFIFPISWILFPALSSIREDKIAVSSGFLRALRIIAFITVPPLCALAATADLVVPILWGVKWMTIITPLKILCFGAIIQCLSSTIYQIFWVNQRPDLAFRANLVQFLTTFFLVIVGGYYLKLEGIALGMLCGTIPNVYFINRALTMAYLNFTRVFSSLLYIFISSFLAGIISFLVGKYSNFLMLGQGLGLILSFLAWMLVFICFSILWLRPLYKEIIKLIYSLR